MNSANKSDIGNFYEFLKAVSERNPRELSFLNASWKDLKQWRSAAQKKVLELLSYFPPELSLIHIYMNETVFLGKEPQEVRKLLLQLYDGRKTTYPVRAFVRMLHKYFGFEDQEVTLENAPELIRRIREKFPEDTEGYYKCLGELSNTEVYLCNHGEVENYDERTTQGRFRWVPYIQLNSDKLNEISQGFGLPTPTTLEEMEDVVQRYIHVAKAGGAVAIKGGAFAYVLDLSLIHIFSIVTILLPLFMT